MSRQVSLVRANPVRASRASAARGGPLPSRPGFFLRANSVSRSARVRGLRPLPRWHGGLLWLLALFFFGCTRSGPSGTETRAAASTAAPKADGGALETAILAGGCFWGMEDILRKIPGVVDTDVGYTGGSTDEPTYDDVHTGKTGHAEAVKIVFDPSQVSFAELLEKWFFRMHDPTTKNRQGNDVGSQYRSAIFYTTPEQKKVAEEVKARIDARGGWKAPIVTEIVAAGTFTLAEDYHQDYLKKDPDGYSCHFLRNDI